MARRLKKITDHKLVIAAKERTKQIIESVPPNDLVQAIKDTPSLRGMILGYIAEIMFVKYVLQPDKNITDIRSHDDHDRNNNKVDRDFLYRGKRITIQLKSIQTNSICLRDNENVLHADVQNDGSDKRDVLLPNGDIVTTTNYKIGDYDILAVPLFPFTGSWDFAYKLNAKCRMTTSNKYSEEQKKYLLSTIEKITFPLSDDWTDSLDKCIDQLWNSNASSSLKVS